MNIKAPKYEKRAKVHQHFAAKVVQIPLAQYSLCVFIFIKTSELGVTEHVEGDPCKFALWVGRTPTSDNKIVLKVSMPDSPSHI